MYWIGIESRCGRDFPHLSRPALGSTQPPVQWYQVFPGGKERPGRDADPSPTSSAPYGPYGLYRAAVPVQGCTLPFTSDVWVAEQIFKMPTFLQSWRHFRLLFQSPIYRSILDAFAKLRKATISFAMSVRSPHPNIKNLGSQGVFINEIWYLSNFRKSVEEIQVSLKSDKYNGHFTWTRLYIYDNVSLNSC
jgi:hypothetical protein